ncbi:malonyl-CoA O-methyltransferase [Modicisalibacter muralis]|uniref:Malonyl-CoA O-methyltransferase n=1 Tax=Modicisalibacter muralis TaxID=119000 RepID=A0A1G9MSS1_9GAMM|nr:methyltransferase domain-containing protein [Halomonas muralis]SDL77163.1 malonyl-CoA O-methyltransferase [Halomonas muralis]
MAAEPALSTKQTFQPPASHDVNYHWRRRVAHAFNRAAPRYAELASAQQAMGNDLWRRLPAQATSILDLGCGPGHWTARLSQRYGVTAMGLDLAPGMLEEACRRHGNRGHWLCADAAALPIASRSIELVFSNLAIQWCRDPAAVFAELYRILTPGGRALINTLGPGTLAEITMAWSRPARPAAVEGFVDVDTLRHAAHEAGFQVLQDSVAERFYYPDLAAVMASIKGVGAQVARDGALLTRRDIAHAARRYEKLRESAGLPVTYQRLTFELIK